MRIEHFLHRPIFKRPTLIGYLDNNYSYYEHKIASSFQANCLSTVTRWPSTDEHWLNNNKNCAILSNGYSKFPICSSFLRWLTLIVQSESYKSLELSSSMILQNLFSRCLNSAPKIVDPSYSNRVKYLTKVEFVTNKTNLPLINISVFSLQRETVF